MISYRKLAMRVLGHSPVSAVKTARRSTAKRAAALALTAALVVGMTLPAFAGTWYIENGDISISAGESGNDVTQNGETTKNDTDTVITNRDTSTASSNTVTIDADEGKTVNVTLDNVTINVDEGYEHGYDPNAYKTAVSVTGSGNTNIELNGNNTLTSGYGHAGLEHNKTDDSGTLTIQDEKNDDGSAKGSASDTTGSLTATGGYHSAGIGGSDKQDGQVTITGGEIIANGGSQGAGIGGGAGNQNAVGGDGDVTISGGTITATGGSLGAGIGGRCLRQWYCHSYRRRYHRKGYGQLWCRYWWRLWRDTGGHSYWRKWHCHHQRRHHHRSLWWLYGCWHRQRLSGSGHSDH